MFIRRSGHGKRRREHDATPVATSAICDEGGIGVGSGELEQLRSVGLAQEAGIDRRVEAGGELLQVAVDRAVAFRSFASVNVVSFPDNAQIAPGVECAS